jgi:hypothetical protein
MNSSSLCFSGPGRSSPATTGLNVVTFLLISLLDTLAIDLSSRRLADLCLESLLHIYSTLVISNPLDLLVPLPRPWSVDIAASFERVANRSSCLTAMGFCSLLWHQRGSPQLVALDFEC